MFNRVLAVATATTAAVASTFIISAAPASADPPVTVEVRDLAPYACRATTNGVTDYPCDAAVYGDGLKSLAVSVINAVVALNPAGLGIVGPIPCPPTPPRSPVDPSAVCHPVNDAASTLGPFVNQILVSIDGLLPEPAPSTHCQTVAGQRVCT